MAVRCYIPMKCNDNTDKSVLSQFCLVTFSLSLSFEAFSAVIVPEQQNHSHSKVQYQDAILFGDRALSVAHQL